MHFKNMFASRLNYKNDNWQASLSTISAGKIDFISQTRVLSLILVEPLNIFKFQINKKKVIFPSISDMGSFRVIKNSVQFQ